MFKVTRFCVRLHTRSGSETLQFYTLAEAQSAARAARKRCDRVEVYEVTGWPVQDLWDRPRLLASRGGDS